MLRVGLLVLSCVACACKTSRVPTHSVAKDHGPSFVVEDEDMTVAKVERASTGGVTSSKSLLLRWVTGRYGLEKKGDESIEVKSKPGQTVCEITVDSVAKVYPGTKVTEIQDALKLLHASKDKTAKNPIFRAYDASRELVGFFDGQEFLIEMMMYQSREVLRPQDASEAFDKSFDLIMSTARDEKLCPGLKDA